jgi:hypothetical protein
MDASYPLPRTGTSSVTRTNALPYVSISQVDAVISSNKPPPAAAKQHLSNPSIVILPCGALPFRSDPA